MKKMQLFVSTAMTFGCLGDTLRFTVSTHTSGSDLEHIYRFVPLSGGVITDLTSFLHVKAVKPLCALSLRPIHTAPPTPRRRRPEQR